MLVLLTVLAAKMQSENTTSTPLPFASLEAATQTASYRFIYPSAEIDVAGRIEPVKTTGLSVLTARFKKYAVSSIVSVPCVTTNPTTPSSFASSLIVLASLIHILSVISSELILHICRASISATSLSFGVALIRSSTVIVPGLYPTIFPSSPTPAIVPPVASIITFSFISH